MRDNGAVATPELAPRRTFGGVVAVWVTAALIGIAIGLFVPPEWRAAWLTVGLGGMPRRRVRDPAVVRPLAGLHRAGGRERARARSWCMGVISLGFGLSSIVPG